jgi:hypothetical protein
MLLRLDDFSLHAANLRSCAETAKYLDGRDMLLNSLRLSRLCAKMGSQTGVPVLLLTKCWACRWAALNGIANRAKPTLSRGRHGLRQNTFLGSPTNTSKTDLMGRTAISQDTPTADLRSVTCGKCYVIIEFRFDLRVLPQDFSIWITPLCPSPWTSSHLSRWKNLSMVPPGVMARTEQM